MEMEIQTRNSMIPKIQNQNKHSSLSQVSLWQVNAARSASLGLMITIEKSKEYKTQQQYNNPQPKTAESPVHTVVAIRNNQEPGTRLLSSVNNVLPHHQASNQPVPPADFKSNSTKSFISRSCQLAYNIIQVYSHISMPRQLHQQSLPNTALHTKGIRTNDSTFYGHTKIGEFYSTHLHSRKSQSKTTKLQLAENIPSHQADVLQRLITRPIATLVQQCCGLAKEESPLDSAVRLAAFLV